MKKHLVDQKRWTGRFTTQTASHAAMPIAAILLAATAQAQDRFWSAGIGDWSNAANWGGDVPDTSLENAYFGGLNGAINMDGNFLAGAIRAAWGAQSTTNTLSGPGTLTINGNTNNVLGFANQAGGAGGTLILNGNMLVNNTGGNLLTQVRNDNSAGNTIVFDTASTLTLNTPLVTLNGVAGTTISLNGTVAASSSYLVVQSNNVSFGTGHDSSSFGQNVFFWGSNRKLAVDGGTVLASGLRFESQGVNNELELNGANVINGANVTTTGAAGNSLLLDVNANQGNMGTISLGTGTTLTLDLLGSSVTNLFFADSSGAAWNDGTVSILGFQENVIKFGTDSSGLTSAQLAAIDGGIYSLTSQGYLTIPEPTALGLLLLGGMGLAVRRRRE